MQRPFPVSCLISRLLLLLVSLLLSQRMAGQSVYGQVWGQLKTAAGTPVSDATVSLTSVATSARTRTKSDRVGNFAISNLAPDLYEIDVRGNGFRRVQGTIAVTVNSTTTVNVRMQPGDPDALASRATAGDSVLQLDRTDVATFYDSHSIAELPLLDRNLTLLQLLVPGAARGQLFIPPNQNPQRGQPVNINGQHFSGSAFQFDGTENRDALEGIVVINPSLGSVREMKVTTQGFNAEFGHATAGVITVQTRSGGNLWHGSAFGFRRTGWGQSDDPFAPGDVPLAKHAIFGGSGGGPILRDKLFIFADYQGLRFLDGANVLLSVPSDKVRESCKGSAGAPDSMCDLSDYVAFIDPAKALRSNPQIPNSQISDAAIELLSFLPPPNYKSQNPRCVNPLVCDNFLRSGNEIFSGDQFNLRADYNLTSGIRLFGRYSFDDFRDTGNPAFGTAGGGLGLGPTGFSGIARTRNQGLATGFTYSLGPKMLTDFRFGYLRYRLAVNSRDDGQMPPVNIPGIFPPDSNDPFATGLGDFEIPGQQFPGAAALSSGDYLRFGYSGQVNDCNCPLREKEQQFQFVNNWTRSSGEHIVKWGADLRYLQNYRLSSGRPRTGFFSFSPTPTGLGLATFLTGQVTSFRRTVSSPAAGDAGERQRRFGFFAQDTWRITSRLTLNYGLRWEIYFPQSVTGPGQGGFLIPSFSNQDPATTYFNVPPVTNEAGSVTNSWRNLAPRLGFAFLLNSSTVIRAGYGRSFDAGYAGSIFGIAATQNPPVSAEQVIEGGGFSLKDGPPRFNLSPGSRFSLLDLASQNIGNPDTSPAIPRSGTALYGLPSSVRVPTVDSWNLAVQHELGAGVYLEVSYVGNKGTHVFTDSALGTFYDLNQPTLQGIIMPILNLKSDQPKCRSGTIVSLNNVPTYCLLRTPFRTFYNRMEVSPDNCAGKCFFDPTIFPVRYFGNDASDNYHSLQARLQKNFSHGYSLMAHYTFSKAFDYDSNYFRIDPGIGYGPASFDIAHRFVMTNIWNLPIGRGKAWFGGMGPLADRFLGGWTLSAITLWRGGTPFTPSYKANNCAADTDPGAPCRPNRVGFVPISGNREHYFATTGGEALTCLPHSNVCPVDPSNGQPVVGIAIGPWQRPGAGQIGNVGRNSFRGPGFWQSDIALSKTIAMTERTILQFRADALNAFNKVNPANPNSCVDCPDGGSINALSPGARQRTMQFSVRLEF